MRDSAEKQRGRRAGAQLVLHGGIVLLLGLLAGIPYGTAITSGWGEEAQRAWKLAHLEGVTNGLLALALGGAAHRLVLSERALRVMVVGVVLAAYGNVVGGALGALTGQRGLAPQGPAANWLVFLCFMFGMWGVLIGVPIAVKGAWNALHRDVG